MFLFHTGSIKSLMKKVPVDAESNMFLFHTGSIKSSLYKQIASLNEKRFYSILVRLKVVFPSVCVVVSFVSIPYWFD